MSMNRNEANQNLSMGKKTSSSEVMNFEVRTSISLEVFSEEREIDQSCVGE
jgi:hypothetical protein